MKRSNRKIKILWLLPLLLLGVIGLSSDWWTKSLSHSLTEQFQLEHYDPKVLEKNQKQTSYYEFDQIQPLTATQIASSYFQAKVASMFGTSKEQGFNDKDFKKHSESSQEAAKRHKTVPVVGAINIPSVHIHIPIVKGVTQYYLSLGAGEMRPEEQMGVHNYSLAGHNYNDDKILFSPLRHIQKGNRIYITNGRKVFVYRVSKKYYVSPKEVSVIDEGTEDKITLITCSMSGKSRLVVQGPLVESYSYHSAKNNKSLWQ